MINGNQLQAVPFLYATEYKQMLGVTATNLYNNITAIKSLAKSIGSTTANVAGEKVGNAFGI